ncbi:hypothetical protein [Actibacterium mucosum]|uniref:hypothetical protein n=1 Tax=Actibacterium mucosum TaxID=1087332 RepID=UPI00137753E0|nr:hypothetical protein [Actibacterium mucosum]
MRVTKVLIKTLCASISLHQASRSARARLFSAGTSAPVAPMPRFCTMCHCG